MMPVRVRTGVQAERCKQPAFAPDCTRAPPIPGLLAEEKKFSEFCGNARVLM
jgi:hypothetical protein